jgi:hypothetical protein
LGDADHHTWPHRITTYRTTVVTTSKLQGAVSKNHRFQNKKLATRTNGKGAAEGVRSDAFGAKGFQKKGDVKANQAGCAVEDAAAIEAAHLLLALASPSDAAFSTPSPRQAAANRR